MLSSWNLLIDGRLTSADDSFAVVGPNDESVIALCPSCSRMQLDTAVGAAKNAFPSWSQSAPAERAAVLQMLAEALKKERAALAAVAALEFGQALEAAEFEVDYSIFLIESCLQLDVVSSVIEDNALRRAEQHWEPLGVVGAIGGWNFPLVTIMQKVIAALFVGNTVVYKASPYTPLSSLNVARLAQSIFPRGVLNVLSGGNELGRWMTEHPDIRKITFTGSISTGKAIMQACAATLKRLTLELGGNDAAIVLADIDVRATAPRIFQAAFTGSGQICTALKRLYVHQDILPALTQELTQLAQAAVVAPIQNRSQRDKVAAMVEEAIQQGATLLAGGQRSTSYGLHYPATLLGNVADSSWIMREECFGPVLPMASFQQVDDAIARANGTSYGLGASVWTNNRSIADAVARRLQAGTVWINTHADVRPNLPLAPAKQSGIGVEYTRLGLESFSQLKLINEFRA